MIQPETETSPPSLSGTLGGWLIEGELGRGGMGQVFRARHPKTRARAAIKVLLGDYSHRPDIVARFRQEAIAVNLINHPGIVRVFDSGESADGSPYIVMEYLEGQSLRGWIEATPAADRPRQIVRLGQQIAAAMAAAHASKVVHRDLKPENILVVDDDLAPGGSRVKILDFGIAKVLWGGVPEVMELDGGGCLEHTGVRAIRTEPAAAPPVPSAAEPPPHPGAAPGQAEAAPGQAGFDVAQAAQTDDALRVLPAVSAGSPPTVACAAPREMVVDAGPFSIRARDDESQRASRISLVAQPTMPFTQEGVRGLGTRSYMAPEQERHSGSVDAKADVYSFGVLLYELLEGQTPEPLGAAWPPPIRAAASPELVALIHKVLSRHPEDRPHMAAVALALQRIGRAKREFDAALSRWSQGNRAPKLLPRGKELHELVAWARDVRDVDDLSSVERGFLDAATAAEAQRERLTRMLLGSGVILLLGMVATASVFWIDAARARRKAESAERAAWDHSTLERAARDEAQRALQKMTEAQQATEEALAAADKASGDARHAEGAREEMNKAKQLAELAASRARGAAQAASVAKSEADAKHQLIAGELSRQIGVLEGERGRLQTELDLVARDLQRVKTALQAKERELRTAELKLSNESAHAASLQQKLDELTGRFDELRRKYAECVMRPPEAPPDGPPPDDEEEAPPPLP